MSLMRAAIIAASCLLVLVLLGFSSLAQAAPPAASTLFFDDFNDGYSGWSASGNVASVSSPSLQPNSVRLKKDGTIWRTVSTVGYRDISVTWNMAAQALEDGDFCYVEVNTGSGWTAIASLTNGEDDQVFRTGTASLGADADQNPNFQVRYRAAGNAVGDYCYAEDIVVSGTADSAATATSTPAPSPTPTPTPTSGGGSTVPGDPLTGSGDVPRTLLTYNDLFFGPAPTGPVDDSAFALPSEAAHPDHVFEGRLELLGEATNGDWQVLRDDYNYDAAPERRHLPEFDFEFVQNGSHLIPVQRGLIITDHPYWNYILGPGRVWKENGDQGFSRAAFPFALVQRNANCTHNGVMTFLFDGTGAISQVRYQITQETCLYFKVNMWGQLAAVYHPGPVSGAEGLRSAYANEVAARFPTKPIEQLPVDYPGVDLTPFTSGITPEHMTAYGLVYNGINYVSECTTRFGTYAFCGSMRLPSYSTAKSAFASVALMRLAQKYGPGVADLLIRDFVPEYAASAGDWSAVTFNHTLDMATGNYRSALYMRDEDSAKMEDFFLAESYADKIALAFDWPDKTTPGTRWVYHTSDTFILTRAMHNYLQSQEGPGADIFEFVVQEVYVPIGIGPGAHTTLRTSDDNWQGQAFGGYGLWWIQDDIAKIATLLNVDSGAAGGVQILEPSLLAAAMQQDPADRGLPTANQPFMYNNGFWAHQFTPDDGYECSFWVPFMSGYGGITVAMMPNGATYYYFSDNDEFDWFDVVREVHDHIASNCAP